MPTWTSLRRPLRIPVLDPGAPCPAAAPDPAGDLSRFGFAGTAWGDGPAYPATPSAAPDRLVVRYNYPPPLQDGTVWSAFKVNWIIDPAYRGGRVLVRGAQLDGTAGLRFDPPPNPVLELKLSKTGTHPSETRIGAAGCYAFQIDGVGFSDLLVFEARQSTS